MCIRDSTNKEVYSNTYIDSEKMAFIESISEGATSNYNKYGILPSITIAQAILADSYTHLMCIRDRFLYEYKRYCKDFRSWS